MRPRLLITLALLVTVPVGVLVLLGQRLLDDAQAQLEAESDALHTSTLRGIDARIQEHLRSQTRDLDAALRQVGDSPAELRSLSQRLPWVRQIFQRDAAGKLRHPSLDAALSNDEREFLRRTEQLWRGDDLLTPPSEQRGAAVALPLGETVAGKTAAASSSADSGWYTFYLQNDLGLIYWVRAADGSSRGAEISRARLLAEVLALLPEEKTDASIALTDARGVVVHRVGHHVPRPEEAARIRLPLSPPLAAWALTFTPGPSLSVAHLSRGTRFFGVVAVGSLAALLLALAAYFYASSTRELRAARQRTSFVNQVSHELKTPLTSIRMYAELLERDPPEDDLESHKRLGVIVSESQRLSRLIGNVLTFARHERGNLTLRPESAVVDEVVAEVLEQLRPALAARGLEVSFTGGCSEPRQVDVDALHQILGNLLSNAEKYAAAGGRVDVETVSEGEVLRLRVADRGPGIAAPHRERVFEAFYRVDDRLAAGATGSGIGLALVRQLARLHGGDVQLVPSDRGACFEVSLLAPRRSV